MKKKYFTILAASLMAFPVMGQETYQDTKLVENELNGTARYVGMGGAMEALGADISTISTNPAGIGLFRHSQVSLSGGFVSQSDATTNLSSYGYNNNLGELDGDKTVASFDQIGGVYTMRTGRNSYMNFAFNYHKSRNFDQILTLGSPLTNASQNKLSVIKHLIGMSEYAYNSVDVNYRNLFFEQSTTDNNEYELKGDPLNATGYVFGQYQKGYIGCYDFNISGNINNRVFLGLTIGIHDVNYRSNSIYYEQLVNNSSDGTVDNPYAISGENLKIDGTGYDIKVGAIFRPIANSPFRIGIYVNSPIFYDLTLRGLTTLSMSSNTISGNNPTPCEYDYRVNTPWKFGFSLGHTIGDYLALGATYEYSDYAGMDNRIKDGGYYDPYYDDWYSSSSSDDIMNDNSDFVLKGVHTVKLGLEVKPIPQFAIRAGYNYQSAIFDEDGYRDGSLASPGVYYATSTDYTNWDDTNRFTFGLGYQLGKFNIDLAYQYTQTDGTFYPFMSYTGDSNSEYDCVATGSKVSFKRNQFLATLSYRF